METTELQPQRRLKLVIAYNGANYHGWQRQAKGIDSVQLRVEKAAIAVLKHPLSVLGASRTDTGVHAEGQVATLRTIHMQIPLNGLRKAINSRLPDDIVIRSIAEVPMSFHSSVSATGKTYRYRLHLAPDRPVHLAGQVWHCRQGVNLEVMRAAARRIVGKHDFAGFTTSRDKRANTVRTVFRCDLEETDTGADLYVQGDGFLYNMVRNIAGTLVEIGRGRFSPNKIDTILTSGQRCQSGLTAPPGGLTLLCLHYPKEAMELE